VFGKAVKARKRGTKGGDFGEKHAVWELLRTGYEDAVDHKT